MRLPVVVVLCHHVRTRHLKPIRLLVTSTYSTAVRGLKKRFSVVGPMGSPGRTTMIMKQEKSDAGAAALRVLSDQAMLNHIARFQRGMPLVVAEYERSLGPLSLPLFFTGPTTWKWLKPLRHTPLAVVRVLCRLCNLPENAPLRSVFTPDLKRNAAHFGRLDVLRWVHESHEPMGGDWTDCMYEACNEGHYAAAWWMLETLMPEVFATKISGAMAAAARDGELVFLQELICRFPADLAPEVLDNALKARQWPVIKYLDEEMQCGCTSEGMDAVAAAGHLDVIKYLHENYTAGYSTKAVTNAVVHNNVDVLAFLLENRNEGYTQQALRDATWRGHLECLKLLCAHPDKRRDLEEGEDVTAFYSSLMTSAMLHGNVSMVKYLYEEHGVSSAKEKTWVFMHVGSLELVRYVYEVMKHPLTASALADAAGSRNVEILQYVMDRTDEGCVWEAWLRAKNALPRDHEAMVKLRERRALLDPSIR